jgi:hypothetical protein
VHVQIALIPERSGHVADQLAGVLDRYALGLRKARKLLTNVVDKIATAYDLPDPVIVSIAAFEKRHDDQFSSTPEFLAGWFPRSPGVCALTKRAATRCAYMLAPDARSRH